MIEGVYLPLPLAFRYYTHLLWILDQLSVSAYLVKSVRGSKFLLIYTESICGLSFVICDLYIKLGFKR